MFISFRMGHEGIYATSAECLAKMGDNYETDVNEAMINAFCLQAESLINCACRVVFAADTTAFAALNTGTQYLLTEVASNLVAMYGLTYKPTGEDGEMSRIEFEDRINIMRDAVLRGLSILRDKKTQTFMGV